METIFTTIRLVLFLKQDKPTWMFTVFVALPCQNPREVAGKIVSEAFSWLGTGSRSFSVIYCSLLFYNITLIIHNYMSIRYIPKMMKGWIGDGPCPELEPLGTAAGNWSNGQRLQADCPIAVWRMRRAGDGSGSSGSSEGFAGPWW